MDNTTARWNENKGDPHWVHARHSLIDVFGYFGSHIGTGGMFP